MSKNDYVFTPAIFYVNHYLAILSRLLSMTYSPSTGPWCEKCAALFLDSAQHLKHWRFRGDFVCPQIAQRKVFWFFECAKLSSNLDLSLPGKNRVGCRRHAEQESVG